MKWFFLSVTLLLSSGSWFSCSAKQWKFEIDKDKNFNFISKVFDLIESEKKNLSFSSSNRKGDVNEGIGTYSNFILYDFYFCFCCHPIRYTALLTPNFKQWASSFDHTQMDPNSIQRQENATEIKNDFSRFSHFRHRFSVSIQSCLRNAFQSHSMEIVFLTAAQSIHYFLAFEFLWEKFYTSLFVLLFTKHISVNRWRRKKSIDVKLQQSASLIFDIKFIRFCL